MCGRKCKISPIWIPAIRISAALDHSPRTLLVVLAGLKACSSARDLDSGKRIHSDAIDRGFHSASYVSNALVHMYSKCGSMELARRVFDAMDHRTVVSWNSLILGYAANEQATLALELFHQMLRAGVSSEPDSRTFVAALSACSSLASREEAKLIDGKLLRLESLERGRSIHALARRKGCDSDTFVANSLIDMYSKCGCLDDARKIFESMIQRTVVSWNSMIIGCVDNGDAEEALRLLSRMEREAGVAPDARTFVAGLMACSHFAKRGGDHKAESLRRGRELHSKAKELGYGSQIFVANTLIDMYTKCGSVADAKSVFDAMPCRDVVSWNSLMLGLADDSGGGDEATVLDLFQRMKAANCCPNTRTFVAVIAACSALAAHSKDEACKTGEEIHRQAVSSGCDSDLFVSSSLVDMYAKCGSMDQARKVFDSMPHHDTVSWNTLLMGYSENGESEAALESFARMRQQGTSTPDGLTLVAVLTACSNLSAIVIGKKVHGDVYRYGFEREVLVSNCLVDFYGSCGSIADAERIFDSAITIDLVTYSSMIAGYSRRGDCQLVLASFNRMIEQGLRPDAMTFSSILTACSHAGLVEKGKSYFEAMSRLYQVSPDKDHYHCLVDMLGRANRLQEALELVRKMPFQPNSLTWTTLLSAATKWNDERIGKIAFESLAKLDDQSSATYSLMANIYTFKSGTS